MRVGSCDISELVLVGEGTANRTDALIYNSFLQVADTGLAGAGQVINGMYGAFGIDPVGKPGIYACPSDFERIIIDRRTDWKLETRLGIASAVLLVLLFSIKYIRK